MTLAEILKDTNYKLTQFNMVEIQHFFLSFSKLNDVVD